MLDVVRPGYANGNEEDEEADDIVNGQDPQNNTPISLEDYLKSDNSSLLQNILNELHNVNAKKWEGKSIDDLFPNFLTYGQVLMEETTVKKVNIIVMELRCSTWHVWCSSNMIKAEIVNEIVKAFGSNRTVIVEKHTKKTFNPESGYCMCKLHEICGVSEGTHTNTTCIIISNRNKKQMVFQCNDSNIVSCSKQKKK